MHLEIMLMKLFYSLLKFRFTAAAFVLALCTPSLYAQNLGTVLKDKFTLEVDAFWGADNYQSLYFSDVTGFNKKTSHGKSYRYANLKLGNIHQVILTNPMKIMLFYKETQSIVFLDNRLNETRVFKIEDLLPASFVDFVGMAGERQFWLYATDINQVIIFDIGLNKALFKSLPLVDKVQAMASDFNQVHVATTQQIKTFNVYGSLLREVDLKSVDQLQLDHKNLYLVHQGQLLRIQGNSWKTVNFSLPDEAYSFYVNSDMLYLYHNNQLSIYQIVNE
ncbi:MAG: hypothetical protein RQ756_01965 [Flavobacteriaceae bacterium]|nr:hypothetical protein [Flavobacteriaceae bacterium]